LPCAPLGAHKRKLDEAGVPIFSAQGIASVVDRAEFVLNWIDILHVRDVWFWNLAPELKLLLGKVLTARAVRLLDVSPGQMLFDELDASASFPAPDSADGTTIFRATGWLRGQTRRRQAAGVGV